MGPGAYAAPTAFDRKAPSYAPFASSSQRVGGLGGEGFVPGPGQYDPPAAVGGASKPSMETPFLSFAERFGAGGATAVVGAGSALGPGAYNVPPGIGARATKRGGRGGAVDGGGVEAAVSWVRVPTAPSIPTRLQSYGYEENEKGRLVMQEPVQKTGYTGRGVGACAVGYDMTSCVCDVMRDAA